MSTAIAAANPANNSNSLVQQYQNAILNDPNFHNAVAQVVPSGVSPHRIKRSIWNAVQQNPDLMACDLRSLLKAGTTAAVLGLEVDNALGQGFLIPFNDNKKGVKIATFMPGYKGYITLAQMSGYMVDAKVVRQKDKFEYYETMDGPFMRHIPASGSITDRGEITHAYARAISHKFPPVLVVMDRVQLEAVREQSVAVKFNKRDSPWFSTNPVAVETMYRKIPIRSLCTKLPLNVQRAAALEDAWEQGKPSHLTTEGQVAGATEENPTDANQIKDVTMTYDQPEEFPDMADPFGGQ